MYDIEKVLNVVDFRFYEVLKDVHNRLRMVFLECPSVNSSGTPFLEQYSGRKRRSKRALRTMFWKKSSK